MAGNNSDRHNMAPPYSWRTLLVRGLQQMGLDFAPQAQQNLLAYVQLLDKWNRVYNLTAVRDPEQVIIRHIFDSLSVLPMLRETRIIDVGTGAGLPGVPLAVVVPELKFTLLDSNMKKTRFITQVVSELGLNNISVVQARAEQFHPQILFDTVVSRAFTSLAGMLKKTGHLCAKGGIFVALKGVYPARELAAVGQDVEVYNVQRVEVPYLDAERHIVGMKWAC